MFDLLPYYCLCPSLFPLSAGLDKAVRYLKPIKAAHPLVSWADLMQLAAATAVEDAGGPRVAMRYGRADAGECPNQIGSVNHASHHSFALSAAAMSSAAARERATTR